MANPKQGPYFYVEFTGITGFTEVKFEDIFENGNPFLSSHLRIDANAGNGAATPFKFQNGGKNEESIAVGGGRLWDGLKVKSIWVNLAAVGDKLEIRAW